MKVALEVARWGLIRIVNYGSTISSLNIHYYDSIFGGVQYIHYQLCHYLLQCSNADWALESKYKLHLPPQMMKYTMIGREYLRLTRDTGGIGGPCFRSYSLPTENSLRTQYVEKISERLLASTTRFFEVTQTQPHLPSN